MEIHGLNLKGKFWPQRISSIIDDPWIEGYEARLLYDEDMQALYFGDDSDWVKITSAEDLFNIGQKLVFASTPLPTKWNIDTTDDKIILVTTAGNQVGTEGGSWAITGMVQGGLHDHFTPGNMSNPTTKGLAGSSEIYSRSGASKHKHDIPDTGNHIHSFQGTWRPVNVLFAIGEYVG